MLKAAISVGQFVPGDSLLHRLDPRTKVLCVVITALAVFIVSSWHGFALLSVFVFISMCLCKIPARMFLHGLFGIWLLLALTFFMHALLTPGELLFSLGILKVTNEGLLGGGQIFLRLALLVLMAFILTFTTSPVNLTAGMESILKPLRRLGVPTHELAMMMTIALRFVPTLINEADKITKAQQSRGADLGAGGLLSRAKSLVPLFVPLFAGALRSAEELAVAMESRCYRGGANRTRMNNLKFSRTDYITLLITSVLFFITIWNKYI